MSYRVLIEWMNIHLKNCLCSSFCQEHCGILKFPGATKLQYSISRIYSIYGRSYKQGTCSTPGMQSLCLFFNYLCSFIFFSLQFLSLFLPRITYNIMKSENVSSSVMSSSWQSHGLQPTRLLCQWNFPGKNTGVGCHFILKGIFPTRGQNLGLLHCRQILYHRATRGGTNGQHKPQIMTEVNLPSQCLQEWRMMLGILTFTLSVCLNSFLRKAEMWRTCDL